PEPSQPITRSAAAARELDSMHPSRFSGSRSFDAFRCSHNENGSRIEGPVLPARLRESMRYQGARLVMAAVAVAVSACVGKYQSDFPIVVLNKVANTIQVVANGSEVGQVASGQTGSFTLHLTETTPNVLTNGVAPTPQADVTLTAKDLKTGALSTTKTMTLTK